MPSSHSPPRCESAVRREQVIRLLQDGAVTVDPTPSMVEEAARLQQFGLITATTSTFVRCSDPRDADFSQSNHGCRGRIYVPAQLEETLDDFYCPDCDRQVFPDVDDKQRHQELLCRVMPSGVLAYLKSLLEHASLKTTSVYEGVLRVDTGPWGVCVCVADYCQEQRCLLPAWASTQPTCYVLVNAKAVQRCFVDEPQANHILLADVICGGVDFVMAVRQAAETPLNGRIQQGIVPLHRKESSLIPVVPKQLIAGRRQFSVAVSDSGVWVEGLRVMGGRAGQRLVMFRLLWKSFMEDVLSEKDPAEFRTYSLQMIRTLLESSLHKQYPDELTVRRMINRVQASLVKRIRRELGLSIGREDIMQTCPWKRQDATDFGYRLNPACVMVATAPRKASHQPS